MLYKQPPENTKPGDHLLVDGKEVIYCGEGDGGLFVFKWVDPSKNEGWQNLWATNSSRSLIDSIQALGFDPNEHAFYDNRDATTIEAIRKPEMQNPSEAKKRTLTQSDKPGTRIIARGRRAVYIQPNGIGQPLFRYDEPRPSDYTLSVDPTSDVSKLTKALGFDPAAKEYGVVGEWDMCEVIGEPEKKSNLGTGLVIAGALLGGVLATLCKSTETTARVENDELADLEETETKDEEMSL